MLRLERVGDTFTGYISLDEGATWLNQGSAIVSATSPLADPNIPIEFGLVYQNFTDLAGQARFDDFSLRTEVRVPEPTTAGLFVMSLLSLVGVIRRRSA
jgi:hypothetical protein